MAGPLPRVSWGCLTAAGPRQAPPRLAATRAWPRARWARRRHGHAPRAAAQTPTKWRSPPGPRRMSSPSHALPRPHPPRRRRLRRRRRQVGRQRERRERRAHMAETRSTCLSAAASGWWPCGGWREGGADWDGRYGGGRARLVVEAASERLVGEQARQHVPATRAKGAQSRKRNKDGLVGTRLASHASPPVTVAASHALCTRRLRNLPRQV